MRDRRPHKKTPNFKLGSKSLEHLVAAEMIYRLTGVIFRTVSPSTDISFVLSGFYVKIYGIVKGESLHNSFDSNNYVLAIWLPRKRFPMAAGRLRYLLSVSDSQRVHSKRQMIQKSALPTRWPAKIELCRKPHRCRTPDMTTLAWAGSNVFADQKLTVPPHGQRSLRRAYTATYNRRRPQWRADVTPNRQYPPRTIWSPRTSIPTDAQADVATSGGSFSPYFLGPTSIGAILSQQQT